MSEFEPALDVVLRHEGGYADNPNDPGGATNFGVSLRFLKGIGDEDKDGWLVGDLDHDGDVDGDDIRAMTRGDAAAIYRRQFWERYGYDKIRSQAVAEKVFDLSVNTGPGRAHRILQEALGRSGRRVKVDGQLGPRTREAVNSVDGRQLLADIRLEQLSFYRQLVVRKASLSEFLRGWERRAVS